MNTKVFGQKMSVNILNYRWLATSLCELPKQTYNSDEWKFFFFQVGRFLIWEIRAGENCFLCCNRVLVATSSRDVVIRLTEYVSFMKYGLCVSSSWNSVCVWSVCTVKQRNLDGSVCSLYYVILYSFFLKKKN